MKKEKDKQTILIVEDETPLIKALTEKLSKAGFAYLEAKNGKEGLKIAKRERPDIILLDIVMPIMDGMTMLQKLKKEEKTKNIPIIILTNLSDEEKIEESVKKGVMDYLVKSDWRIEDVVKKVKEKLK